MSDLGPDASASQAGSSTVHPQVAVNPYPMPDYATVTPLPRSRRNSFNLGTMLSGRGVLDDRERAPKRTVDLPEKISSIQPRGWKAFRRHFEAAVLVDAEYYKRAGNLEIAFLQSFGGKLLEAALTFVPVSETDYRTTADVQTAARQALEELEVAFGETPERTRVRAMAEFKKLWQDGE